MIEPFQFETEIQLPVLAMHLDLDRGLQPCDQRSEDHCARNRQLHRFLRIGRGIGYGSCGDLLRLLSFAFKFQERFAGAVGDDFTRSLRATGVNAPLVP